MKKICVLLCTFMFSNLVVADIDAPFASANRSPFVLIYGLPTAQGAKLTETGRMDFSWQMGVASNYAADNASAADPTDETILIDGETRFNVLQMRYGFADKLELGIDIPYLRHSGGSLDGFINDWHDFFGLPSGGRKEADDDQLLYSFQSGDDSVLLVSPQQGLGDISLSVGYRFVNTDTRTVSLRGGIKLPSGEEKSLLGSGSTDVYLGLNLSDSYSPRLQWHTSAGLLWMGKAEILNRSRNNWVAYGSATLSYSLSERVSLKSQLDVHSAFYDSSTTELGSASAQLILGGAIQLTTNWLVNLSVSEDIVVDASPDVVFQIGLVMKSH